MPGNPIAAGSRRARPLPSWAEPRLAWLRDRARNAALWEPLLVFLAFRALTYGLGLIGMVLVQPQPADLPPFSVNPVASGWIRWDAVWYLRIAQGGYWYDAQSPSQSYAFFPLYPLLTRLAAMVTRDVSVAGLLVSNLSFAAALGLLYDLAKRHFDRQVARWTVLLLAASPFSFFFYAAYTESLFLLLSVASFWLAEKGRWGGSALVGALCSATRLVGLALVPALMVMCTERKGFNKRAIRVLLLVACAVPLGAAAYAAYCFWQRGDPLFFYSASALGWQRYNVLTEGLARLNFLMYAPGNHQIVNLANLAVGLVCLAAVVPVWRKLGAAYAVFVLSGVLVPLSAGLESLGRYVTVLFPFFMVLAASSSPFVLRLAVAGSSLLLGLFTLLFVNWYWMI